MIAWDLGFGVWVIQSMFQLMSEVRVRPASMNVADIHCDDLVALEAVEIEIRTILNERVEIFKCKPTITE